jgi:hypothetical protein
MEPRFDAGKIRIQDEAMAALACSGQDPDFFLEKHVLGDWGEGSTTFNEEGLRVGSLVLSRFRTLRGMAIWIFTLLGTNETFVFRPSQVQLKWAASGVFGPAVAVPPYGVSNAPSLGGPDELSSTDQYTYDHGNLQPPLNDRTVVYSPSTPSTIGDFTYSVSDGHSKAALPSDSPEPEIDGYDSPCYGTEITCPPATLTVSDGPIVYTPSEPSTTDHFTYTISDGHSNLSLPPDSPKPEPEAEPEE